MAAALLVKGHTLLDEGRLMTYFGPRSGSGRGRCSCGQESPTLASTAARKQWHREHKAEIWAAVEQVSVERALAQVMRPTR